MSTSTIWGMSQESIQIAPGIMRYETASHGGYHLSNKLQRQVPDYFKNIGFGTDKGWYEEDCNWAIVVLLFPQFFSTDMYNHAVDIIKAWLPHEWQQYCNEPINHVESCRDCQTGNCIKAGYTYPRIIANTGYGKYRIITSENSPGKFKTLITVKNQFKDVCMSNNETAARLTHGQMYDKLDKSDAYEPNWGDFREVS